MVSKKGLSIGLKIFGLKKSLGIGLESKFWSRHSVVKVRILESKPKSKLDLRVIHLDWSIEMLFSFTLKSFSSRCLGKHGRCTSNIEDDLRNIARKITTCPTVRKIAPHFFRGFLYGVLSFMLAVFQ